MKEKNHKCKLCFRIFPNSRSLASHMRSHRHQLGGDDSSSTSFESYLSADYPVAYELRENPRKSFRVADPDSAESETESTRNPTRRPSRRTRKLRLGDHRRRPKRSVEEKRGWVFDSPPAAEQEPVSSVSDASPEEEVAMFLVMMSRDVNWRKRNRRFSNADDEIEVREIEIAMKEEEEDEEIRERSRVCRRGINNKLKCENCMKQFRSSPALATHRRICSLNTDGGANAAAERRIFRCPYCYKVFGSGQALGGHKRSHLSTNGSYPCPPPPPPAVKSSSGLLDLNFPPAATEDDDYSSVVSDA